MGSVHGVRRGVLALAGFVLGGALLSGDARLARADDVPEKGDKVVISLNQEVTLEDFLKSIGPRLGVRLAWDPSTKLIRDKKIVGHDLSATPSRLLSLVRKMLVPYDLVMIPMGTESERWYFIADAKQQGAVLRLKAEVIELNEKNLSQYEGEDGLFVSATIPIRALKTLRDARTALTKVTTMNLGNVTEVPDASAFVVTDFAPNVVAIYRLIRQLDVAPPPESPGRLVALKHARAETVARMLSAHVAQPAPNPARPVQPGEPLPGPGPRVSADTRTNQILVGGTPSEVEAILKLIQGLDVPVETPPAAAPVATAPQPPSTVVLQLEHADGQELARVLQSLANMSMLWNTPEGVRPAFLAGPRPNLLVVAAPEKSMAAIRALVASLDVPGK
jgi:type II secretory pathway component GspD/PulD (secretin)